VDSVPFWTLFKFHFSLAFCSTSYVNQSPQWHSAVRAWIVLDFKWIPVFLLLLLLLSTCDYIIKTSTKKLQSPDVTKMQLHTSNLVR